MIQGRAPVRSRIRSPGRHSRRHLAIAALLAAVPLLSGCIAAVAALPVITGTTIASKEMRQRAQRAKARAQAAAATIEAQPAAPSPGGPATSGPAPRVTLMPRMTELPAPDQTAGSASNGFTTFGGFALAQARATGNERVSAMKAALSSPLSPRPIPCPKGPAAVMLDLDPDGVPIDPTRPVTAAPGLAATLTSLREAGLTVVWITRDGEKSGTALRSALARSGLDPEGADQLVLAGGARDVLAAHREAVADKYCVVALAGDRRGDFDLLYDYLRDANALVPTDRLIGNGWFLVPSPLN